LAINGEGFFKVIDPGSGKEYYTRDGVFYIDQNGYVVNSSGYRLVGELRNITAARSTEPYSRVQYTDTVSSTTTLTLQVNGKDGPLGKRTSFTIDTAQRADINAGEGYSIAAGGTTTLSNPLLGFADGDKITVTYTNNYTGETLSTDITIGDADTMTVNDLKSQIDGIGGGGVVEMVYTSMGSNDTINFRTIDCGPGVSLSITVKNSSGAPKDAFTGTNSDFIDGYARTSGTGDDVDTIIAKINAQTANVGVRASKDEQNRLVLRTVYTGTDAEIEIGGDAAAYLGLPSGIVKNPGNTYTGAIQLINGPAASLNISNDGVITGTDSNGNMLEWEDGTATVTNADFAQINLYTFSNQDGLQRVNKNLFVVSESSGTATPGKPGSAGYGTIESGYLEMSNVDLTDEFTNMITTQRGYQASARIITVSDTMLEELINLKR
ncbi:MAG: flagellar hook protein FlgE, partial [Thermoanaerobacter sp.]|nr:flagellar hook protein FlgE [Thermoanaerobacter sp.]